MHLSIMWWNMFWCTITFILVQLTVFRVQEVYLFSCKITLHLFFLATYFSPCCWYFIFLRLLTHWSVGLGTAVFSICLLPPSVKLKLPTTVRTWQDPVPMQSCTALVWHQNIWPLLIVFRTRVKYCKVINAAIQWFLLNPQTPWLGTWKCLSRACVVVSREIILQQRFWFCIINASILLVPHNVCLMHLNTKICSKHTTWESQGHFSFFIIKNDTLWTNSQ